MRLTTSFLTFTITCTVECLLVPQAKLFVSLNHLVGVAVGFERGVARFGFSTERRALMINSRRDALFPAGACATALRFHYPSPGKAMPMPVERRQSSRIPFAAAAEIIDEAENTRSASQLCDLSLNGCFVELKNPFPEGTPVTIEIYKDEDFVETPATVAYNMPKRGMGLTFVGMEPQFALILKKWIAQAKRPVGQAAGRPRVARPASTHQQPIRKALFRLVGERELGLFVDDQWPNESVRGSGARHVDRDGKNSSHALLEIEDVCGCLWRRWRSHGRA